MILLYNTNFTHNPNAYLTLAVERSLRTLLGASSVVRADNRTLLPLAASGRFDTLICIDGQRLLGGLIARARQAFRRTILWAFEDPFMLDYNLKHEALFDLIFTNDPSCVDFYGAKGRFLPLAANRSLHFRPVLGDERLRHDVFFAGTMWPNRVPVITRLIEAFPSARFKLVCPTNEYLPPLPPVLAERAIVRPISHEAFVDFANQSRVSLTLFRDYASHGDASLATSPGPRLFELGLAGTAQVVQAPRMPRSGFRDTDGIALCDTAAELVDEVGRLLSDPVLRGQRARQAQDAMTAHHTYEARLAELLEVADQAPTRAITGPSSGSGKRRLRVLMCTHSTLKNQVWGGVEVYQETLANTLAADVETFYWLRSGGTCRLIDGAGESLEQFDLPDIGWLEVLCDADEERVFSDVLSGYGIDVVHFQHLGHHAASLPIIAKSSGVGVVFSVHDFFLACSRYNLLDYDQRYCRIDEKSISACNVCLRVSEGLPDGTQQQRRLFLEQVLGSVDTLLFGSAHSERLLLRMYPQIEATRRLLLGIPSPPSALPSRTDDHAPRRVLRVAVVGNFIRTKGADTVLNVIAGANSGLFEFHIFGQVEPQYAAALQPYERLNVTVHGRYKPGDAALSDYDVALHLSVWPETYCITLSEAWKAGLIPIVTDIGALGDRVEHDVNGFKVAVGDASGVVDTLELIRAVPAIRARIRANIGPHLWTEPRDYAARILAEYRAVAPGRPLSTALLSMDVGQLHILPKRSWRELSPPRHILDPQRGSSVATHYAGAIHDWISVQGSEFHLDAICGESKVLADDAHATGPMRFTPRDEFTIQGWTFVPGASVAGQIHVVLIPRSDAQHVIFIKGERAFRPDINTTFPLAPTRSGFLARARLNGKWCDGTYHVGVVNVVGSEAAFQLSQRIVRVYEGRVTDIRATAPDNDTILSAFAQVYARTTSRPDPQDAAGTPAADAPATPVQDATETMVADAPQGDASEKREKGRRSPRVANGERIRA